MKVEVTTNNLCNFGTIVPVVRREEDVIVWCNHADTRMQKHDFGSPDYIKGDWVDDIRRIEACGKCRAWRHVGQQEWNEE